MSPAYSWVNCLLNRLDGPGCFLVLATSSDVCDLFTKVPSPFSAGFEGRLPITKIEMGRKIVLFHKNTIIGSFIHFF